MQPLLLPWPAEELNFCYLGVTADHLLRSSWAAGPDYPTARAARETGFRNCSGDIAALTIGRETYRYDEPLRRLLQEWHRWQHRHCADPTRPGRELSPPEPFIAILCPPGRQQPHGRADLLPGIRPHRWQKLPGLREYEQYLWQCADCRSAIGVARRRDLAACYNCAGPPAVPDWGNPATVPTVARCGQRRRQPT